MPEVNLTETETNPTVDRAAGGGGLRELTHTETSPWHYGGAGGGWRSFTATESSPEYFIPVSHEALGKHKGFDFRGKGLRI